MKTTSKKVASKKSSTSTVALTPRETAALLRKAAKAKAAQVAHQEAIAAAAAEDREWSRRYDRAMAAFKKMAEPKLGALGCDEVYNVVLVTGTSTARPSAQQMWSFADLASAKAAMSKLLRRAAYEEVVNRKAPSEFLAEPIGFRIVHVDGRGTASVVVPTVNPRAWVVDTFGG